MEKEEELQDVVVDLSKTDKEKKKKDKEKKKDAKEGKEDKPKKDKTEKKDAAATNPDGTAEAGAGQPTPKADPKTGSEEAKPTPAEPVKDTFVNPYTYEFLLERINNTIKKKNTYSAQNQTMTLREINIEKQSKTKSYWMKYKEFCHSLGRAPEHFSAYLREELGINVMMAEEILVLEGRRIEKNKIEEVTKKYVKEYIQCPNCKSVSTDMEKNQNRMFVLKCRDCHSQRTVTKIRV